VVVESDDPALIALVQEWRWKELFWGRRAELPGRMRFRLFGHALYEKALRPFTGITGRGIVLPRALQVPGAGPAQDLAALDASLAAYLRDGERLRATRELAVVPVLGVPGWCPDNESGAYYDDAGYFRPARAGTARGRACVTPSAPARTR